MIAALSPDAFGLFLMVGWLAVIAGLVLLFRRRL